jgi:hypothetical protein
MMTASTLDDDRVALDEDRIDTPMKTASTLDDDRVDTPMKTASTLDDDRVDTR